MANKPISGKIQYRQKLRKSYNNKIILNQISYNKYPDNSCFLHLGNIFSSQIPIKFDLVYLLEKNITYN